MFKFERNTGMSQEENPEIYVYYMLCKCDALLPCPYADASKQTVW